MREKAPGIEVGVIDNARRRTCRGVGRKVADCIALYAFDQLECVPLDTHMLKVAKTHLPANAGARFSKGLSQSTYDRVADSFRAHFGPAAGWAQCFLFADEREGTAAPRRKRSRPSA
eukprot:Polyplicarium_translucidae@DN1694_c0_g1_i3.p3